uniref:Uncharacterized protein n=1 Tax=Arundo donax TaxID=35708 RepID=A0A0A9GER3_ARUDO
MYVARHEEHTEPTRTRSGISSRPKISIRMSSGRSGNSLPTVAASKSGE